MPTFFQKKPSTDASRPELIADGGARWLIPESDEIGKYTLAKCCQLMDELVDKKIVDRRIPWLFKMPLPAIREALIALVKSKEEEERRIPGT